MLGVPNPLHQTIERVKVYENINQSNWLYLFIALERQLLKQEI